MGRFTAITGCLILALLSGCRSSNRCELVEAELRAKDRELRELQSRVNGLAAMNQALEGELIQRQLPPGMRPPDNGGAVVGPQDLVLDRGTGGYNDDGVSGDEGLQVVVLPRDEDAQPVRAVGDLTVYAFQIEAGGTKIPLCGWQVSANDLRRTWKSGLLTRGYHVVLPWKRFPTQDRLRVVAQLRLSTGRVLEAEKDITIHLPKQSTLPPPKIIESEVPSTPTSPMSPGPILSKRPAATLEAYPLPARP